jgi:hypothetical protein
MTENELREYAFQPGEKIVATCWRGSGKPRSEDSTRTWEVRVLEVKVRPDGKLVWLEGEAQGASFYGDFATLSGAESRARLTAKRCQLPYLGNMSVGQLVWTLEAAVIDALKEL